MSDVHIMSGAEADAVEAEINRLRELVERERMYRRAFEKSEVMAVASFRKAEAARDEWRDLAHRWELEAKNYRALLSDARDRLADDGWLEEEPLMARIDTALKGDDCE